MPIGYRREEIFFEDHKQLPLERVAPLSRLLVSLTWEGVQALRQSAKENFAISTRHSPICAETIDHANV
jgi:hypothetical protein